MRPASRLAPRSTGLAERLPASLADLRGPETGEVTVPLHVAWSGMRTFDVQNPSLRLMLYHLVLVEGRRTDIETLLARPYLVGMWHRLRTMVGPSHRDLWESRFPELIVKRRRTGAAGAIGEEVRGFQEHAGIVALARAAGEDREAAFERGLRWLLAGMRVSLRARNPARPGDSG